MNSAAKNDAMIEEIEKIAKDIDGPRKNADTEKREVKEGEFDVGHLQPDEETSGTGILADVDKLPENNKEGAVVPSDKLHDIMHDYYIDTDKEVAYIVQQHFKKIPSKDIDFDYISKVAPHFFEYVDRVEEAVNTYTSSFEFADMDFMDRVIFVLGYIEFLLVETPKEVIINEMVELGKRYGDDASPKLLNGIGHKILTNLEANSDDSKETA